MYITLHQYAADVENSMYCSTASQPNSQPVVQQKGSWNFMSTTTWLVLNMNFERYSYLIHSLTIHLLVFYNFHSIFSPIQLHTSSITLNTFMPLWIIGYFLSSSFYFRLTSQKRNIQNNSMLVNQSNKSMSDKLSPWHQHDNLNFEHKKNR